MPRRGVDRVDFRLAARPALGIPVVAVAPDGGKPLIQRLEPMQLFRRRAAHVGGDQELPVLLGMFRRLADRDGDAIVEPLRHPLPGRQRQPCPHFRVGPLVRDEMPVEPSGRQQDAIAIHLREGALAPEGLQTLFRDAGMHDRMRSHIAIGRADRPFSPVHGLSKSGLRGLIRAGLDVDIGRDGHEPESLRHVELAALDSAAPGEKCQQRNQYGNEFAANDGFIFTEVEPRSAYSVARVGFAAHGFSFSAPSNGGRKVHNTL